ncbi:hypothetical protein GCM10011367_20870 [Marinicauda pacifica]|uniref:YscD/Y4YQ C-terminal domain-containing protein n=1 Tax=Marinicauda pacifica TaxID=1133559 RepID=A0A4S2H8T1_9PROT|nr:MULTISPECIES: hypothetical protein [Marinicauda]TGY92093.1 hypothetical protein E5162_10520 [Marinicauda pacifica]GGE45927.1 hypothetical protein GCM10011367_20870 [Marinicauda pacifica]
MTSGARLLAALAVLILAGLAGLASGFQGANPTPVAGLGSWQRVEPPSATNIDRFARQITSSGLFPLAGLREPDAQTDGQISTAEDLARAIASPDLSAMVLRDEAWTLFLYASSGTEAERKRVGDVLADGWQISEIGPTHVTLQRDGTTRRLDAFSRVEDDGDD